MSFVEETEELVETASQRIEMSVSTEMPFPDNGCAVTGLVAEAVREGFFTNRKTGIRVLIAGADGIELKSETRLVSSRDQPRARCGAKGCRDIPVGKADPVRSDRVDMRSGDVGIRLLTAEFSVSKVVGNDEYDIRKGSPGCRLHGKSREDQDQGVKQASHPTIVDKGRVLAQEAFSLLADPGYFVSSAWRTFKR